MASIIFTPKDIFDQEFKTSLRGFDKAEVDDFLDNVIKDYETYAALVKELKEENARLKEKLASKLSQDDSSSDASLLARSMPSMEVPQTTASVTNFDILRRLNRLEKEVFGKHILESDAAN